MILAIVSTDMTFCYSRIVHALRTKVTKR